MRFSGYTRGFNRILLVICSCNVRESTKYSRYESRVYDWLAKHWKLVVNEANVCMYGLSIVCSMHVHSCELLVLLIQMRKHPYARTHTRAHSSYCSTLLWHGMYFCVMPRAGISVDCSIQAIFSRRTERDEWGQENWYVLSYIIYFISFHLLCIIDFQRGTNGYTCTSGDVLHAYVYDQHFSFSFPCSLCVRLYTREMRRKCSGCMCVCACVHVFDMNASTFFYILHVEL